MDEPPLSGEGIKTTIPEDVRARQRARIAQGWIHAPLKILEAPPGPDGHRSDGQHAAICALPLPRTGWDSHFEAVGQRQPVPFPPHRLPLTVPATLPGPRAPLRGCSGWIWSCAC